MIDGGIFRFHRRACKGVSEACMVDNASCICHDGACMIDNEAFIFHGRACKWVARACIGDDEACIGDDGACVGDNFISFY